MRKIFSPFFLAFGLLLCGLTQAFTPQSGTWIVSNEQNGAPGRGLAIDVQTDVLVMQIYAYEASGNPTFYMASGQLINNQIVAKLGKYVGGRFLGSGPRSGVETNSPGLVKLRFTSGYEGFITLPGEGEVAINRFMFGSEGKATDLGGSWIYVDEDSGGNDGDLVTLSVNKGATAGGTGFMYDPIKNMGCEYLKVNDGRYNIYCGTIQGQYIIWNSKITITGNEGEGITLDANGNKIGVVYVRKLKDALGKYLGIYR